MNTVGRRDDCAVCGLDMKALLWSSTDTQRGAWLRQVECGICDRCQVDRQAVAEEIERSRQEIRELTNYGSSQMAVTAATHRYAGAYRRGVALKMWPEDPALFR